MGQNLVVVVVYTHYKVGLKEWELILLICTKKSKILELELVKDAVLSELGFCYLLIWRTNVIYVYWTVLYLSPISTRFYSVVNIGYWHFTCSAVTRALPFIAVEEIWLTARLIY